MHPYWNLLKNPRSVRPQLQQLGPWPRHSWLSSLHSGAVFVTPLCICDLQNSLFSEQSGRGLRYLTVFSTSVLPVDGQGLRQPQPGSFSLLLHHAAVHLHHLISPRQVCVRACVRVHCFQSYTANCLLTRKTQWEKCINSL